MFYRCVVLSLLIRSVYLVGVAPVDVAAALSDYSEELDDIKRKIEKFLMLFSIPSLDEIPDIGEWLEDELMTRWSAILINRMRPPSLTQEVLDRLRPTVDKFWGNLLYVHGKMEGVDVAVAVMKNRLDGVVKDVDGIKASRKFILRLQRDPLLTKVATQLDALVIRFDALSISTPDERIDGIIRDVERIEGVLAVVPTLGRDPLLKSLVTRFDALVIPTPDKRIDSVISDVKEIKDAFDAVENMTPQSPDVKPSKEAETIEEKFEQAAEQAKEVLDKALESGPQMLNDAVGQAGTYLNQQAWQAYVMGAIVGLLVISLTVVVHLERRLETAEGLVVGLRADLDSSLRR